VYLRSKFSITACINGCLMLQPLLDNSRIAISRTGRLADWSTSGVDKSRTGQLVDATGDFECLTHLNFFFLNCILNCIMVEFVNSLINER